MLKPIVRSSPTFEPAFNVLAANYLAKNQNDKVIALLETRSLPEDIILQRAVTLGIAYARTGQKAKAAAKLKIAETPGSDGYTNLYKIAGFYTALNDHQRALDLLESAYAERDSNMIFLNVDPLFVQLRSEPRFRKLISK